MKKLRKNSGFTLIECVVAMAVLAVMTLGLLMILNVTVKQRNANTKLENEVDSQVEKLVQDGETTAAPISGADIDFGDGIKINGAKKEYYDDSDASLQIGKLSYDVGSSPSTGDPTNPGNPGAPAADPNENLGQAYNSENFRVYGAADVTGQVHINESKTGTDIYTVTWVVDFKTNSGNQEKSVKIVLPVGAYEVDCPNAGRVNCDVSYMGRGIEGSDTIVRIVRVQPGIVNGEWDKNFKYSDLADPLKTEVTITFKIKKTDYEAYDCLGYYITGDEKSQGKGTNDISVNLNT